MFNKISMEISLKPFCFDTTEAGMIQRIEEILRQWESLWQNDEAVQFMLWTGDGSELFDYTRRDEDTFDYARYLGGASSMYDRKRPKDLRTSILHEQCRLFIEKPPVWNYGMLRKLVSTMKVVFKRMYGRNLEVGTTVDPGPEFASSDFKYKRHPEMLGNMLGGKFFISCCNKLNGDSHYYAAYPDGIVEGTSFGTFFGRQASLFLKDMDLDFIWFSNGLGFGVDTWAAKGSVFDGQEFHIENAGDTWSKVISFWQDFRRECPDIRIETRGTNLSTGVDLASDGLPLKEIYAIENVQAPPNSPWAALDANFGLELCGYMSHIAGLADNRPYPFRFYIHDIWWLNSPWLDRYDRTPHDIYLPLAITRLNSKGECENPSIFNILSVDDSYGQTPDQVPREVLPFLMDSLNTSPDQAGPIVWIYPFDEYHAMLEEKCTPELPYGEDWQMIAAVNDGFPVNTVVSTSNFMLIPSEILDGRIFVAPTSVSDDVFDRLLEYTQRGAYIIFYGGTQSFKIRNFFNLEVLSPISGDIEIPGKGKVRFNPVWSCGLLDADVKKGTSDVEVIHSFVKDGERRAAFILKDNCAFIRTANAISDVGRLANRLPVDEFMDSAVFFRDAACLAKWSFMLDKFETGSLSPRLTVRLHDNAFYYSWFGTDSTVGYRFSTPDGVPIFRGRETIIQNGEGLYQAEKCCNLEARIFVRNNRNGVVSCKEMTHENIGQKRRMLLQGLKNADITIRLPLDNSEDVLLMNDSGFRTLYAKSDYTYEKSYDAYGEKIIVHNVSGKLEISWGKKEKEFFL